MSHSFRNDLSSDTRSSRRRLFPQGKPGIPNGLQVLPTPRDPKNPFGPPPRIEAPVPPVNIWDDGPARPAPDARGMVPPWPLPPVIPPSPDPFPDPAKPSLPYLFWEQQPVPYRLNPWNFPGQGQGEPGGLLGMIGAMLQLGLYDPSDRRANVGDAFGANLPSRPIEIQVSAEPHFRSWNQREFRSRADRPAKVRVAQPPIFFPL